MVDEEGAPIPVFNEWNLTFTDRGSAKANCVDDLDAGIDACVEGVVSGFASDIEENSRPAMDCRNLPTLQTNCVVRMKMQPRDRWLPRGMADPYRLPVPGERWYPTEVAMVVGHDRYLTEMPEHLPHVRRAREKMADPNTQRRREVDNVPHDRCARRQLA